MQFNFHMPVQIFSGEGCVRAHAEAFRIGTRCAIITSRHAAKASGALDDVLAVLDGLNIPHIQFDGVSENPLLSVCEEGGRVCAAFGADFVVGIGGGSVMDAAKAIAAFALHPNIHGTALFNGASDASLPLICIPTTAGTGSEVNPYAVLSLDGEQRKKTFKSPHSYARYAFLDAAYTASLRPEYTLSTALDAFAHCFESFVSPKSSAISELFAVWGAQNLWETFLKIRNGIALDSDDRERLLYASCAGGFAINTTGTGFPHPLGYNLTMFHGIPHGRACGAFAAAYVDYTSKNDAGRARIDAFCSRTGIDREALRTVIPALADVRLRLSDAEIDLFVDKVKSAGNFANNPYVISPDEMRDIYHSLF